MLGANSHDMITVHQVPQMVHEEDPVAVAVQSDSQIGIMPPDQALQSRRDRWSRIAG